jgi:2-amino-4-hydroxy-6-hydroxymethyldihydropteridine diphosphokinase
VAAQAPTPTPVQDAATPAPQAHVAPVAAPAAPQPAVAPAPPTEDAAEPAPEPVPPPAPMRRASDRLKAAGPAPEPRVAPVSASKAPSRADAMIAAIAGMRGDAPAPAPAMRASADVRKLAGTTCPAYLSLGSNIEPERNLRTAIAALRARFGDIEVSPVYRTKSVGFDGPDFLNAVAIVHSDLNPFALHRWLHRLEEAQGRDRRDASYSNRPLDVDIIYFGDFVLDGPGDFQLPRPELQHAFVLKPLADIAPDFVDPIRNVTLARLWAIHPGHDAPPERVELAL